MDFRYILSTIFVLIALDVQCSNKDHLGTNRAVKVSVNEKLALVRRVEEIAPLLGKGHDSKIFREITKRVGKFTRDPLVYVIDRTGKFLAHPEFAGGYASSSNQIVTASIAAENGKFIRYRNFHKPCGPYGKLAYVKNILCDSGPCTVAAGICLK